MSLENTLREMLNEMKMPPYKKPLDPTVHTGPEEKPLPPGVHTGPQKPPVPSHPQKPKPKISEITRKSRGGMQEGIDKKSLVRIGAIGALGHAAIGSAAGLAFSLDQLAHRQVADHAAAGRAGRDVTNAYHKLQQTADAKRKANAAAMAPGMEKTVTTKSRRRLEETLVEYYKQRLDEKLDRSKVKGTITQRLAADASRAGFSPELVGLSSTFAKMLGTPQTQRDELTRHRDEVMRATGRVRQAPDTAMQYSDAYHETRRLGLPVEAAWLMTNKGAAAASDARGRGISRRERGLAAEKETGYIAARQAASRARKVARGLAEHYEQRLQEGVIGDTVARVRNMMKGVGFSTNKQLDAMPKRVFMPANPRAERKLKRQDSMKPGTTRYTKPDEFGQVRIDAKDQDGNVATFRGTAGGRAEAWAGGRKKHRRAYFPGDPYAG